MSSLSVDPQRRASRLRRRRSRGGIPLEIETSLVNESNEQDNWIASHGRGQVRVLPGSMVPWMTPLPPSEQPPVPTEMIRFVVIGSSDSGVSSVVQKFLLRSIGTEEFGDGHDGALKQAGLHGSWSVKYHKKDIAFWQNSGETIGCIRVQVWDVGGVDPIHGRMEREKELCTLLQQASAVMLVASVQNGVDEMMSSLCKWKKWFEKRLDPSSTQDALSRIPIHLLINKCDLLPNQSLSIEPSDWIHLGSALGSLTTELGFESFRMVSAQSDSKTLSVEDAFMDTIRSLSPPTMNGNMNTYPEVVQAEALPVYPYSPKRRANR